MISLSNQTATLEHMTPYAEKHGEDSVNGLALKLSVDVPMARLDDFKPGLVGALYTSGGLRFSDLGPLKWTRELVGATVRIDADDLLGERVLVFGGATVDKFVLSPKEGGTVEIVLRVKIKPEPEQVAVIYELQHKDVLLTIDPAKASDQAAGDREDELALEGAED
jgi:hypothetical protein